MFIECTDLAGETLHPACWKTRAFQITGCERLLVLDADAVISEIAPNPFDLSPQLMKVVSDRQTYNPARNKAETDEWEIVTGKRFEPANYFNSGMILASWLYHRDLFHEAYQLCRKFPHLCWHDQTPFNVVVQSDPFPDQTVAFIDESWNFHNPAGRLPDWQRMKKFIYHFPGNPDRNQQIEQTLWQ